MYTQRRRWRLWAGLALTGAAIGIAASVNAAVGSSDIGLSCPAGSKTMVHFADYELTDPIDGFDTPEAALSYLVEKAYPGMPRGQFKKISSDQSTAEFESDHATSTVIEVDRRVPNQEQTELITIENGTAWLVQEFVICESNARRWATR